MKIEDVELGIGYSRDLEVSQANFPQYKTGINRRQQNMVRKCHEIGYDTFQTAHWMKVVESTVKSFWPKRKRRTKEEMADG